MDPVIVWSLYSQVPEPKGFPAFVCVFQFITCIF